MARSPRSLGGSSAASRCGARRRHASHTHGRAWLPWWTAHAGVASCADLDVVTWHRYEVVKTGRRKNDTQWFPLDEIKNPKALETWAATATAAAHEAAGIAPNSGGCRFLINIVKIQLFAGQFSIFSIKFCQSCHFSINCLTIILLNNSNRKRSSASDALQIESSEASRAP